MSILPWNPMLADEGLCSVWIFERRPFPQQIHWPLSIHPAGNWRRGKSAPGPDKGAQDRALCRGCGEFQQKVDLAVVFR
jgi:hypothetical protein